MSVLKIFSSSPTHPGKLGVTGSRGPSMPCLSVPYAKINVNHTCGFYSTTPFGFTFLSKPLLSWGSRAETQLLAASSLSFLINCVYQKVQSGMLGTREPVTPCFVAQNLWGFLCWRLPRLCLETSKVLLFPRRSSKLVRKM